MGGTNTRDRESCGAMPRHVQIPLFQPHGPAAGKGEPRYLFFALRPDAEAGQQIRNLATQLRDIHGLEGKITDTEQLHMTLCFLGSVSKLPPDAVTAADAAARTLQADPFLLTFDRAKSFPGSNAFVLCQEEACQSLLQLRNRLLIALARSGRFPLERRAFRAHVTLMHDPKLVGLREVEPVGWTVRELVLMRSHHGLMPYQVLGRYPLERRNPASPSTLMNATERPLRDISSL
jgi:RNA 2',3'-cyclic 3'-phosphodiesterase